MIIINSKHIIFNTITTSIFIFLREKGLPCCLSEEIDYEKDDLYIFIGINKLITKYPSRYIIYQFEQADSYFYNDQFQKEYNYFFTEEYFNILKNAYQVWDYSEKNIKWLKSNLKLNNIIYVPICYCHLLKKKNLLATPKNIDILFYGSLNNKRKNILDNLKNNFNLNVAIKNNNIWGDDLDKLIYSSKIVLNIHFYENSTLEMHRISYLLNNKCFIISEKTDEINLMNKYSDGIIFCEYSKIIESCLFWLKQDEHKRNHISNSGYSIFKKESFDKYINQDIFKIEKEIDIIKSNKIKKNKISWYKPTDFKEPETVKDNINNYYTLKMPYIEDSCLPNISIITPTGNRRKLFSIAINNFYNCIYPKNKIEWIIVDDGDQDLSDILSFSKSIKYIKLNNSKRLPLGEKRNICIENCNNEYIICMDDDDFYTPESVLARVKILMKYPEIDCVGCNSIGCYDLLSGRSYLSTDGSKNLSEASMAFRKKFWLERKFNNSDTYAENKYFILYRDEKIMVIPFQFIIIAINHKTNSSNRLKYISNNEINQENISDLSQIFDLETNNLFTQLKKIL